MAKENHMEVDKSVAASRFLTFFGLTLSTVGALLLLSLDIVWFWGMFAVGWPFIFLGIWGKGVIQMGIEQEEAKKATKETSETTS